MATVFWDADGVMNVNYLQRATIMNGKYFANLLLGLHDSIKAKRRGVLFHQENAPVHTCLIAMRSVKDCGF